MKLKPCDDSQHEHKVQQVDQKLDMFWISPRGRECLELDQSYTNPSRFVSFRLHDTPTGKLDGSDLVPFEALLELARRGWTHERRMTSRKVDTYKPNGTKKWFFQQECMQILLEGPAQFRPTLWNGAEGDLPLPTSHILQNHFVHDEVPREVEHRETLAIPIVLHLDAAASDQTNGQENICWYDWYGLRRGMWRQTFGMRGAGGGGWGARRYAR